MKKKIEFFPEAAKLLLISLISKIFITVSKHQFAGSSNGSQFLSAVDGKYHSVNKRSLRRRSRNNSGLVTVNLIEN